MEVSSSAATGALRVGLQVISSCRRPVLEIYYELHNDFGPEIVSRSRIAGESRRRFQDIFVAFYVVNIGGMRAENVLLSFSGGFSRKRSLGARFGTEIAQMAPGQVVHLFQLQQHDIFLEQPNEGRR